MHPIILTGFGKYQFTKAENDMLWLIKTRFYPGI